MSVLGRHPRKREHSSSSNSIGQTLRAILLSFGLEATPIGGLHSLIWLLRGDGVVENTAVMSANAGEHYTRWFPLMDTVTMPEDEPREKVFGLGSLTHRRQVAEYLVKKGWWLGYCSRCGKVMETGSATNSIHQSSLTRRV